MFFTLNAELLSKISLKSVTEYVLFVRNTYSRRNASFLALSPGHKWPGDKAKKLAFRGVKTVYILRLKAVA